MKQAQQPLRVICIPSDAERLVGSQWEILSSGYAITVDLYCRQLDQVAEKFKGKQDRIYDLHDKVRPRAAQSTSEKFLKLG